MMVLLEGDLQGFVDGLHVELSLVQVVELDRQRGAAANIQVDFLEITF